MASLAALAIIAKTFKARYAGVIYLGGALSQLQESLVMSGEWIYSESVNKEVHIIKSNFRAGSGDYLDERSIRDDQYGEFYGVIIGSYSNRREPRGGDYETLNQAVEYATNVCPSLVWK